MDEDNETVKIDSTTLTWPSYTVDMSSSVTMPSTYWSSPNSNVTISTGGTGSSGQYLYTTSGANGTSSWGTPSSGLRVSGDSEFEGDVKVKGRSLEKMFQKIEDRLAILQDPDPAKLEKYAALKKAYDHYKTLERLIGED
jgi:hypothetical protein